MSLHGAAPQGNALASTGLSAVSGPLHPPSLIRPVIAPRDPAGPGLSVCTPNTADRHDIIGEHHPEEMLRDRNDLTGRLEADLLEVELMLPGLLEPYLVLETADLVGCFVNGRTQVDERQEGSHRAQRVQGPEECTAAGGDVSPPEMTRSGVGPPSGVSKRPDRHVCLLRRSET